MTHMIVAELVCHMQLGESNTPPPENAINIIREVIAMEKLSFLIKYYKENLQLQLAPKLSDIFHLCTFRGVIMDCSAMFVETLTNEGICWTFNMLQNKQIFTKKYIYVKT